MNKGKSDKGVFIGYFLAGYPDRESCIDILKESQQNGVDIFEIGFPSSDPSSDGAIIKSAHTKLDHRIGFDIELWREIRRAIDKPIWIMGYQKDFIDTEFYKRIVEERLADALILPDCTQDRRKAIRSEVSPVGIDVLGFVNPEMQKSEWKDSFDSFQQIYFQLYAGPTGNHVDESQYQELFSYSRQFKNVKCYAGFGIKTPEMSRDLIKKGFTGIIIGTEMVRLLNVSKEQLYQFIGDTKSAIQGV